MPAALIFIWGFSKCLRYGLREVVPHTRVSNTIYFHDRMAVGDECGLENGGQVGALG